MANVRIPFVSAPLYLPCAHCPLKGSYATVAKKELIPLCNLTTVNLGCAVVCPALLCDGHLLALPLEARILPKDIIRCVDVHGVKLPEPQAVVAGCRLGPLCSHTDEGA